TNEIGIGGNTHTIPYAGSWNDVAPRIRHNAERVSGLDRGEAREMPATQDFARNRTGIVEQRSIQSVADVQNLALIEIRTGARQTHVIGVEEVAVVAIGRIVERVRPGIRQGEL